MISRKELAYVNLWAKKTPYPGDAYSEEAMEKLKNSIRLYEQFYKNNKYNIIFSDNEEIDLEIQDRNLSHLLGIDFMNLISETFKDFRKNVLSLDPESRISAYQLLKLIVENSDKVIEFDKSNHYLRAINYYKLSIKNDIFSKIGDLTKFNYGCINFDKKEYLKHSTFEYRPNSTKYFYLPSEEAICPYFFMGFMQKDEDGKIIKMELEEELKIEDSINYIPETLVAPDQPKYFFENQEVVIPTQILKINDNEMIKYTATPAQKKQLLKEYENLIREYKIKNNINIYADYISTLSQEEKELKKSLTI